MKKISYTDKQMIHTLANNGESIRTIAEALGIPKSTVWDALKQKIELPYYPETSSDGCYTTNTHNGRLQEITPADYGKDLTNNQPGTMTKLDSGYPDIYYNEQSKRWEVWKDGKRMWRATSLTQACEVRLKKGNLTSTERQLLQAVIDSPPEVQEALNYPPI